MTAVTLCNLRGLPAQFLRSGCAISDGVFTTMREQEQLQLMQLVKQAFDDSSQRYGAEKIRIVLANTGIHTSKKRISAIMRELNLESVR